MSKIRSIVPHWNGHLICAIDTETTGLQAGYHEMIQIAIMPLNAEYLPDPEIQPFVCMVKPDHPARWEDGAARVNGLRGVAEKHGLDANVAYQMFVEWYYALGLPETNSPPYFKQIIPLAKNWAFDRGFVNAWMGLDDDRKPAMDQFIRSREARDLQPLIYFMNDLAYIHDEKIYPFPKQSLTYACSRLSIPHPNAHDALGDCEATARCYRRLLDMQLPTGLDLGIKLADSNSSND